MKIMWKNNEARGYAVGTYGDTRYHVTKLDDGSFGIVVAHSNGEVKYHLPKTDTLANAKKRCAEHIKHLQEMNAEVTRIFSSL